ncbi:hypothetical protein [Methanimicrococcus stummii]|uniref:hypothetical protein n=1 Tax=Methanimicrococcus stummii TaxID=3028294 RepID=UPI00292D2628|nr:hypothetical protein [Methanimicrococcus sp. Es2]
MPEFTVRESKANKGNSGMSLKYKRIFRIPGSFLLFLKNGRRLGNFKAAMQSINPLSQCRLTAEKSLIFQACSLGTLFGSMPTGGKEAETACSLACLTEAGLPLSVSKSANNQKVWVKPVLQKRNPVF